MTPSRTRTGNLRGNLRTSTRLTTQAAGVRGIYAVKRVTAAATAAAEEGLDGNVGTSRDAHFRASTPGTADATFSKATAPTTYPEAVVTSSEAIHAVNCTQHAAAVTATKTVADATSTDRNALGPLRAAVAGTGTCEEAYLAPNQAAAVSDAAKATAVDAAEVADGRAYPRAISTATMNSPIIIE